MSVSYGGDSITFADGSVNSSGFIGHRNRIINGAMMVDQRNAGASVTPTAHAYTLDRWLANLTAASKFSVAQSTVVPAGFTNSVLLTSTSAYSIVAGDYNAFQHRIEANNMMDAGWGTANAQTFTLSFWVRSSLTGTFGGSLYFPASTTRTFPFSYVINSANTWEQKSIIITGDTATNTAPTGNSLHVIVQWALGVGSTYTTGTTGWQNGNFGSPTGCTNLIATNGANLYLTGVQLERGSTASSFEYRSYGAELALCQRYFTKSQTTGNAVGAADGQNLLAWYAVNTAVLAGWASHKVSMRTAPTITIYKQDGTINATNRFTDGAAVTGTTTCPEPGIEGFRYVSNASSGFTAGTYYQFYYVASAEL